MLQGQKKKNLRSSEWKASVVPEKDAPKEAEEKKADNEVETLRQNLRPLTNTVVYTPSRKKKLEVVPILRYLDEKLEKYARPSDVVSYVDLVRNKMRTKMVASTATAKQRSVAEDQLGELEAKLLELEERNRQLAEQTNKALTEKVKRCLRYFVIWQIETQKWLKLRDLERQVTAMITCSVGGQRQLARK
ncbi:hypothetical protein AXG93_2956s1000 [Marchantia polymorpha subsp. ruderalis]|uniref:Uncharacterized protein n=1 Tax=Marchantia polymorpha subsp. ruderalis TaxID=1480154 RepID=A0A176WAT0_MARPO|nr:hypothetical protein AXG93_2956s1000 [Marchantia polymorpha subsp. ruderalis]